jgi:hypothetical protein
MAEFLSDAPLSQLFTLMLCPLVAAMLLVAFLFFSFNRRRRKSAMKLGIQPKTETDNESMDEQRASFDEDIDNISSEGSSTTGADEQPIPIEEELNLNVLAGTVEPEETVASSSENIASVDLAARLGGQSDQPAPKESQQLTVAEGSMPAEQTTSVAQSSSEKDADELLRFLRHPQTKQLIVEVAGQRYGKLTDITDREVGQYILELAAHFLAFTNGVVATGAGVKSVYLPKVEQVPEPLVKTPVTNLSDPDDLEPSETNAQETPEPDPLVPPPPPEAEAAFLASLQDAQLTPQPTAPPVKKGRGFLGLSRSSNEPPPAVPHFNLAGEINQIVQTRLMASPLAATTNIEILSDLSGGIRIKVNGEKYASPDDVPDPDVKALIKESIKQWERS